MRRAPDDGSTDHETGANSGSDCDEHQIPFASTAPDPMLADDGQVDIVLHKNPYPERILQHRAKVDLVQSTNVRGKPYGPRTRVGHTCNADDGQLDAVPADVVSVCRRPAQSCGLSCYRNAATRVGGLDDIVEDVASEISDGGTNLGAAKIHDDNARGSADRLIDRCRAPDMAMCAARLANPATALEPGHDLAHGLLRKPGLPRDSCPRDGPVMDD